MKPTATLTRLVDADATTTNDLTTRLRARTTVADVDAAHRAGIVTAYYTARADGDLAAELAALVDATLYDNAHPGESLVAELCADEQAVAA